MEERFEYYWRVYTLAFQLGMKLAVRCEGFQHIIAISAPGCNITYSPFIWLDDRGQVCTVSLVRISKDIEIFSWCPGGIAHSQCFQGTTEARQQAI